MLLADHIPRANGRAPALMPHRANRLPSGGCQTLGLGCRLLALLLLADCTPARLMTLIPPPPVAALRPLPAPPLDAIPDPSPPQLAERLEPAIVLLSVPKPPQPTRARPAPVVPASVLPVPVLAAAVPTGGAPDGATPPLQPQSAELRRFGGYLGGVLSIDIAPAAGPAPVR